jgi:hypothetical protein
MLTYNGLTDSLIKAVKDVMEGEKKVHQHKAFGFTTEQKMDPVGKHDADINNDGKVDKSDKYLHNRRKAISKAMGEKKSSSVVMNPIVKEDAQLDEADMTKISTERLREIIKSAENQRVSPGFGTKLIAAKQELKRRKNNASIEEMSSKEKMKRGLYNSQVGEMSSKEKMKRGLYNSQVGEMSSKEKMKRGLYNSQEQTQVSSGLENPHNCATHVYSEEWGDGRTITTMHADPDAQGNIAWYDVMFEHGIQKGVPIEELEVVLSESHMHSKRGKK